jgi:hypothetical protein
MPPRKQKIKLVFSSSLAGLKASSKLLPLSVHRIGCDRLEELRHESQAIGTNLLPPVRTAPGKSEHRLYTRRILGD